ncbi:MAG: cytochrome c [Phycisphaerales bacterium]|nr:cytochrome c [Phycisphaerales bacterium]
MNRKNLRGAVRTAMVAASAGLALSLLAGMAQPGKDKNSEPWIAPPRAAKKVNPVAPDAKSIELGKRLFERDCVSCHGSKGLGDGPKAGELERKPTSFADASIWDQSDGAFFWKITEGKAPMPSEKALMSEDERWHVINYMRTLAPPEAVPVAPQYAASEPQRKAISVVLRAYGPVRSALVGKGDGPAAAKAAPAVAEAAAALAKTDGTALPEAARSSWSEDTGALSSAAGTLKSAGEDVGKLREALAATSASLTRIIERYGHAEGGPVMLFGAPGGAGGNSWLQTDARGQDPYGRTDAGVAQRPVKRLGAKKKS